ncbi:hypothetical protein SAMN05421765_0393 [Kaistella antarctica]|uniref:Uncharacterized protein n=1 Tax=Kaistella antarctica TaxID=266748 RepID=A0A448NTF4_9FLAO|nr:hypothetical protein SAMN05421765_0393 [Kaistella antarctica]VEI00618.1 Uncharacterised protein [Kaistella antarctica]
MISREVFFINLKRNADLYSSLQPDLSGALPRPMTGEAGTEGA